MPSCLAIIVSYNPDLSVLKKQIHVLLPQVSNILLLDNASLEEPFELLVQDLNEQQLSQLVMHRFASNLGLAAAYNYGINYGIKFAEEDQQARFSHVLLMDQDSLPEQSMVAQLFFAEKSLLEQGFSPAVLGANYSDRDNNKTIYINSNNCPVKRYSCTEEKQLIDCDHVISSGSLISLSVLQQVGLMDEALFIDLVDVDWGLRARSSGYQCYAVCAAKMSHAIGEECRTVTLFGHILNHSSNKSFNRRVNIHSPLRYYYQFRNSFLLYKQPYVSWCWIRYHFPRHIFLKLGYCLFFSSPRVDNLKMMLLGIYHGVIGRGGKLE